MNTWEQLQEKVNGYWDILILNIPQIAISLLIICGFILLSYAVGKIFRKKMASDNTNSITVGFIIRITKFVLISIGLILAFHALGFEGIAGGLLAGAGMGAIIIGFAFKEIGENFLAGIILVFDRPFDVGDVVNINNNMGVVKSLLFRTTHIKSFDGKDVYVPNAAIIRNDVLNFTRDGLLRHEFVIGMDYDDDVDQALALIYKTVNAHPTVMRDFTTQAIVSEFAPTTINLKLLFWIDTLDYKNEALITRSEVMRDVKNALSAAGFTLPANIQEIKAYQGNAVPITIQYAEEAQKLKR
jgi:small-conductance mechanosensitive channel